MGYPDHDAEIEILTDGTRGHSTAALKPVMDTATCCR